MMLLSVRMVQRCSYYVGVCPLSGEIVTSNTIDEPLHHKIIVDVKNRFKKIDVMVVDI